MALKPNQDLSGAAQRSLLFVASGSVRVDEEGRASEVANVGDFVGIATALGGVPTPTRVEAITAGSAIAFHRSELFEVLADHIDLLQSIHSGLLKSASRAADPLSV